MSKHQNFHIAAWFLLPETLAFEGASLGRSLPLPMSHYLLEISTLEEDRVLIPPSRFFAPTFLCGCGRRPHTMRGQLPRIFVLVLGPCSWDLFLATPILRTDLTSLSIRLIV
jgi:hypothetical protein